MFVLPPPPSRHINAGIYGQPGGGPIIETANTLAHPTGPEYQLVVGEGTYNLKDSLHLATPPPHPSDVPQPNNNPLAPSTGPPTGGTRLTLPGLSPRRPPAQALFRFGSAQRDIHSIQEETQSPKSDAGSMGTGFGSTAYYNQISSFGSDNPALQAPATKGKKDQKAKPKNNIVKSNSSFVSRVIPHEALTKRLSERSVDGILAFANVDRAFLWLDLSSEVKTENLTKVLFTKANVLCHDINQATKSLTHLDVIMGFNTGDIIWYEPISQKYTRINKNGQINPTPIKSIQWLPNKDNLFIAAHFDGTLIVYDKEKEDAILTFEQGLENGHANGDTNGHKQHPFKVLKSVQSREQKTNPVAAWKVSNMKINNMAFSPDGQYLALAGDDGTLTILDYINERVSDVYRAYYGAMLCVTWSPDGRYILTGGQDDLVSIWSLSERALVARGIGHHSWVTDVRFDPWRCDERNYRFGSVGEDCHLLLWDFSVGMLGRARAPSFRYHSSIASHANAGGAGRRESTSTVGRIRSNSSRTTAEAGDGGESIEADGRDLDVVCAVDSKASTAVLPPVMSKSVDDHPLCWLGFEEHSILVSCKDGHVREFERPKESSNDGGGKGS